MDAEKARDATYTLDPEAEYYALQSEVGRFDTLTHGIKSWSITVSAALIAAAAYRDLPSLCLLAATSSAIFWATEARWKRYQAIHRIRLTALEELMAAGAPYDGPRISSSFQAALDADRPEVDADAGWPQRIWLRNLPVWRKELGFALYRNVRRPHHVLMALALLAAAILWLAGAPT
ncbi:hypothetical protein ACK8OR_05355 [Jannaschia sp. KMU-145]|uniref:hypothetical protein n=1 Tax=Jannaschia halovivens TaxID=3388667 RepID=UPI00396B2FCE